MTNEEFIKGLSTEQLAKWLDETGAFDDAPWLRWFNDNYCFKCPVEEVYVEKFDTTVDCAWCERHNDRCKFFPEYESAPNSAEIIKLWLQAENK